MSSACGSYDHLHNNSSVVSEIKEEPLCPPKMTITLKFSPEPNVVVECPPRGVSVAGRVTCNMKEIICKLQHDLEISRALGFLNCVVPNDEDV